MIVQFIDLVSHSESTLLGGWWISADFPRDKIPAWIKL